MNDKISFGEALLRSAGVYLVVALSLGLVFVYLLHGGDFQSFWSGGKHGAITLKQVAIFAPILAAILEFASSWRRIKES